MHVQNALRVNQIIHTIVTAVFLWSTAFLVAFSIPSIIAALHLLPQGFNSQPTGSTASVAPAAPADNRSAGTSASFNWAGYAALGSFTGVSGSWDVPAVAAGASPIASDATWIGVGGVASTDLLQAGTQAMIEDGRVTYHAWYEMLPDAMTYVPLDVHSGDAVSASIIESGPGTWQISIVDVTTGKSYQKAVKYDSSLSSADWIEERPSIASGGLLPLSNFVNITWHSAEALKSGVWQSASALGAQPISMLTQEGYPLAQPTALAANTSAFTVARADQSSLAEAPSAASLPASPNKVVVLPWGISVPLPFPATPNILMPSGSDHTSSNYSYSESYSGRNSAHGAYYLYVDGRLVQKKQW